MATISPPTYYYRHLSCCNLILTYAQRALRDAIQDDACILSVILHDPPPEHQQLYRDTWRQVFSSSDTGVKGKKENKAKQSKTNKDVNTYIATRRSLASGFYGIGITTITLTTRLHQHLVIQNEVALRQIKGGFARRVVRYSCDAPTWGRWILLQTCILWLKQIES